MTRRLTERVDLKERGIIKEVSIGFRGIVILAFCLASVWCVVFLVTAIDGTMLIGGPVQSTQHLLMMASLQSGVVFAAVLLVWLLWDVILNAAWFLSLLGR